MNRADITLRETLSASHREELARRMFFLAEEIIDFEIPGAEDDGVDRVVLVQTLSTPERQSEIEAAVHAEVAELATLRFVPEKVIWVSPHERTPGDTVFEELVSQGEVIEVGDGQVAFGPTVMALLDHFDRVFRDLAVESFGAREYRYPTLISTRTLETAGYLRSFPQALMLVTRLHNDSANYRDFEREYGDSAEIDGGILRYCRNADLCLPPTMCYHSFAQLQGSRLAEGERAVVTAVGKSFRFESRYATTLERLWDFTIREIVFLGSRAEVLQCRADFMQGAIDYVNELGFAGRCEVANDPFFCSADAASSVFSQRLMELKYELRLDVGFGRDIAVASFNFHVEHFGGCFDIAFEDGPPVNTACVGFGLERLVFALLSQFGIDPAGWPPSVRDAVAS